MEAPLGKRRQCRSAVYTPDDVRAGADRSCIDVWRCQYEALDGRQLETALEQGYHPNVLFEDNIMAVRGTDQVRAQFHGLRMAVDHIEIEERSIRVREPYQSELWNDLVYDLEVEHIQKYYLPHFLKGFVPRYLPWWVTTTLTISTSSKRILYHKDQWHNYFCWPYIIRSIVGRASSAFMISVLGW